MNLKEIINGNYVKNIIKNITGEYNEDLEQEACVKIWKNSEKYKEQGNLKAWVRTVTANVTKDYLKSSAHKMSQQTVSDEEILIEIKDKKSTPENELVRRERQKTISAAINSLKPKLREIIILYEINNCSYEEISQKLKCPIGTVKSRLYNAKKELAEQLRELL